VATRLMDLMKYLVLGFC